MQSGISQQQQGFNNLQHHQQQQHYGAMGGQHHGTRGVVSAGGNNFVNPVNGAGAGGQMMPNNQMINNFQTNGAPIITNKMQQVKTHKQFNNLELFLKGNKSYFYRIFLTDHLRRQ